MRQRIAKSTNYRKRARDAAADLLADVAEVVRGSPSTVLQASQMPFLIVRVVSDEVDGETSLRGDATVSMDLTVNAVVSEGGEDRIDELLTECDQRLFDKPTLNGAVDGLVYDSFTLEDPEIQGDMPVYSGTAVYIARARR